MVNWNSVKQEEQGHKTSKGEFKFMIGEEQLFANRYFFVTSKLVPSHQLPHFDSDERMILFMTKTLRLVRKRNNYLTFSRQASLARQMPSTVPPSLQGWQISANFTRYVSHVWKCRIENTPSIICDKVRMPPGHKHGLQECSRNSSQEDSFSHFCFELE